MKQLAALRAKTYSYLIDNNDEDKKVKKKKKKKKKKCVIKRKLLFEELNFFLDVTLLENKIKTRKTKFGVESLRESYKEFLKITN